MKNIFNLLLVSALAMSMQGCSKDLVVTDEPNDPEKFEEVQLRLTGEVAYMTPETRLDANGFVDNDEFGVYTTGGKMGPNKATVKNAKYVYKNGTIEAADDNNMIYWEDGKDLDIYAYYPYYSGSENKTQHLFTLPTDQSNESNYNKSDFLRATEEDVAKNANPVEMTFFHLMSKVSVTITHDSSITDFDSLAKELTIENVVGTAKINLSTGVVTPGSSADKKITAFLMDSDNASFSAIMIPQGASNVKFRLKLGNDYYSSTMSINYESGKEYKYTFKVTKNEGALSLKSTKIEIWGDGGTTATNMTKENSTSSN